MRMTFRWYGENDDKITLQQIDQIPGMDGIVGALFDIPVGEVWPVEPLLHIKKQAEANNLVFKDLESINVHEDIKLGLPSRDQYIENYITSLRNAAKAGIQRNLCHGELCGQQKVSGIIKSSGIHIIRESGVELFRKYPGEDKTADTEFFRETVQGQFLRVVGIQIEKQPLLQLQILRAFPGLQGERG